MGGVSTLPADMTTYVSPGATLDLSGNSQWVGRLSSANGSQGVDGSNGIVTNSSTTPAVLVNNQTNGVFVNFGGQNTGPLGNAKTGPNSNFLYSEQTYTGPTLVNGGALNLYDNAALSNTSGVSLSYATMTLENGTASSRAALSNRINDAAAISMRGAWLTLNGRDNAVVEEKAGDLIL
jgi:autotransporter-associated beta strand protein